MSLFRPGDEILVSDNVDGPTRESTEETLPEFNMNAKFYNPEKIENLKSKVTKKTKLILVENPGSNTFEFQDLSKIVKLAKSKNILTLLDNTWGTALYLKPIKIGFDMSFCSATKYLSGHSDAMGGTLAVNKKVYKKIKRPKRLIGSKKIKAIKSKTKYKLKIKTKIKINTKKSKARVSNKTKQVILAIIRIQDKIKFNINFSLDKFLLSFFQSIANSIDNFKIILVEERERKKQEKIKLMEKEKVENIRKVKFDRVISKKK